MRNELVIDTCGCVYAFMSPLQRCEVLKLHDGGFIKSLNYPVIRVSKSVSEEGIKRRRFVDGHHCMSFCILMADGVP